MKTKQFLILAACVFAGGFLATYFKQAPVTAYDDYYTVSSLDDRVEAKALKPEDFAPGSYDIIGVGETASGFVATVAKDGGPSVSFVSLGFNPLETFGDKLLVSKGKMEVTRSSPVPLTRDGETRLQAGKYAVLDVVSQSLEQRGGVFLPVVYTEPPQGGFRVVATTYSVQLGRMDGSGVVIPMLPISWFPGKPGDTWSISKEGSASLEPNTAQTAFGTVEKVKD